MVQISFVLHAQQIVNSVILLLDVLIVTMVSSELKVIQHYVLHVLQVVPIVQEQVLVEHVFQQCMLIHHKHVHYVQPLIVLHAIMSLWFALNAAQGLFWLVVIVLLAH